MNFFKKESSLSQMADAETISIKASRIYATLLAISVLVIVAFKSLDQTTITETILSPSLATYDRLQATYPSTLSCSCQQIGIFTNTFVTIQPKIHQVSDSSQRIFSTGIFSTECSARRKISVQTIFIEYLEKNTSRPN